MLRRWLGLVVVLALSLFAPAAGTADDVPAGDARGRLGAFAALVDQRMDYLHRALLIVAATENARSGDWRRIKGPLEIVRGSDAALAAVWFAKPDGDYYTVDGHLTGLSLRDRDYFPALMAGREVKGELVVSRSTGKRSAVIAVPIRAGQRVIGALGVSMALEPVAAEIDKQLSPPPEVMFYALDHHGQIALHRQSSLVFEFATRLGDSSLTQAVGRMLTEPEGTVRYRFQGAERTAIFQRSEITGWVYALRW